MTLKIKILEKIVCSQDEEKFDIVTTEVSGAPKPANVGIRSVAVPELQQSRIQSIKNDVPRPLESTVPVPMPMIDNSVMNSSPQCKQAQKKKRKSRGW